jgi:hypothetical protein
VLFLTLIERNPIVYADYEETHEKLEFPNAVTSNISILLANITGEYQLLLVLFVVWDVGAFLYAARLSINKANTRME